MSSPASPASPAFSQNRSSPRTSMQTTNSLTTSSEVFVINALDKISLTRESRRNKALKEAVDTALKMLKNNEPVAEGQTRSSVILTALQLAIDTRSANLMAISLDCLGKFITYNYVGDMENEVAQTQVMEKVVDGICDCFIGEETDKKVQLQIIKTLLDAVYSTSNPLHLSPLLKAVRTTYNIFLLSRNNDNQTIAQITMTQMVDHIFRRVKQNPNHVPETTTSSIENIDKLEGIEKEPSEEANSTVNDETEPKENGVSAEESKEQEDLQKAVASNAPHETEGDSATYQQQIIVEANMARTEMNHKLPTGKSKDNYEDFLNDTANVFQEENRVSVPGSNNNTLTVPAHSATNTYGEKGSFDNEEMQSEDTETDADLYIKDAILVFRALCKLSKKSIQSEWGNDMRSYSMRSKLLSLHLILTIMTSHIDVFTSDIVFFSAAVLEPSSHKSNPFILEVKQYLCPSIGRNAFSVVPQVFDITHEILWRVVQGLRVYLKNEIEIFLKEIVLRILEMRSASNQQKFSLLKGVLRLCEDPQTLIDVYLNYDCDREALDNIYERLVNVLSKITTSHNNQPHSNGKYDESQSDLTSGHGVYSHNMMIPPSLTTATILHSDRQNQAATLPESVIRFKSLECLVAVLRSLVAWYSNNSVSITANGSVIKKDEERTPRESEDNNNGSSSSLMHHANNSGSPLTYHVNGSSTALNGSSSRLDNPEEFENLKHRKQLLQEGIRQFNWKPKKGLAMLDSHGFLNINDPKSIVGFLLNTEGLNKTQIGEYLGEGEADQIVIMHAFVDEMNFTNMKFIEALRFFLQAFRLPGEGQKIDRFMLKFADRYVHFNTGIFSNAETAYVLAYSVMMLNTDLHNPQNKRRMTLEDFVKNNRGIDDGADIPRDILEATFEEIQKNEIKMKDEVEAANEAALVSTPGTTGVLAISGIQNALVNAGITRDVRREAYQAATEEMGTKTEALFRNILTSRRRAGENDTITFYSASHVEHVRPMFEVAWMAFLAGISGPLQESDDFSTVSLCLEGFKHAIRIICLFHTVQSEDMDLQRDAFVTTLTKFTFLTNLNEMKPKNMEAIKTLLEVAAVDGNYLKGSWKEILSTVSQLERFQLITSGLGGGGMSMQESSNTATNKKTASVKASIDFGRRASNTSGRTRASGATRSATQLSLTEEVTSASSSQSLVLAVDRLFTSTVNLNGEAIVDFVRALCETSWEEIVSSAHMEHPRMYSLQKLVEISYYNMNRIRMEWSNMWAILGEYYNKVGCQSNFNVAFFALDSLRQLAMQFLEKEELPHFKFQKDFLMPFREVLANNPDVAIKDMVLRCLSQMIQARSHHLRSGWKTMLSVFATGARESSESIVHMTFDIVRSVNNERFGDIVANGTFPDYISCLVEFSKNQKFQKISLPALDMIKGTIPKMLAIANTSTPLEITDAHAITTTNTTIQASGDDFLVKFWFAVLYGLKEIVMQSEDVEVRKRALVYLFETLKTHGSTFTPEFWTTISRQIVFLLFDDLKPEGNASHRRKMSPDDLSVWLSTTMVEALRNVVDLYTFYFDNMRDMMRHVLNLFSMCITQDSDTLAHIGCECLDQYIEANVEKFDASCWDLVSETFTFLFEKTTANGLFDDTEDLVERVKALPGHEQPDSSDLLSEVSEERQRNFQQVIIKCVLQLLLIQTINDLLAKDIVYCAYPASHLMVLMGCLGRSFHFAKKFNIDNDLRMALFRFGFMKQLPNLLKQETSSGGCYVSVLMRMYANLENISDRDAERKEIEKILIPLCNEIFSLYTELDHETKPKNIAAWTPVVVNILSGLSLLQDEDFLRHVPTFYLPSVELLGQENLLPEIRMALRTLLTRIGKAYHITSK